RTSEQDAPRGLDILVQASFVGRTPTLRWGALRSVSVSLTKKRQRYAGCSTNYPPSPSELTTPMGYN
ncbi:MAG: hypothetical protein ACK4P5_04490, partial [Fimbriimonadales bacterium]